MKIESKYLGKTFNGWKVVEKITAPGKHNIYKLMMKKLFTIKTMLVRDNEMTKFLKGKSIVTEQLGKNYQLRKNIRKVQNTVSVNKSLFNLFKKI